MAFPFAERDYSLYSSSNNEGSVGRAHHDLDRCAKILNEVLDNGAGILDGVKKRKSLSSPGKDTSNLQHKKVRQTNRIVSSDNRLSHRISSSTPFPTPLSQGRRPRSSSASSSYSYSKVRPQRRHRSLSEQRTSSVTGSGNRRGKDRARSCSAHRHTSAAKSGKLLDCVSSFFDNHSLTSSEADTLTGVHLDNSSQFGIPPVFNANGHKRNGKAATKPRSSVSRHVNIGWLKPQASAATQTAVSDKENHPEENVKPCRKKKQTKQAVDRKSSTAKAKPVRLPLSKEPVQQTDVLAAQQLPSPTISSLVTKSCSVKENDVDDLLERTLENEEVATQVGMETLNTRGARRDTVAALMSRLKAAACTHNLSWFDSELEKVSSTLTSMLSDSKYSSVSVETLLVPFQREAKELRQRVVELKQQIRREQDSCRSRLDVASGGIKESDNLLARDLTVKVVEAETRNTQLTNQLADTRRELEEEKKKFSGLVQSDNCSPPGGAQQLHSDQPQLAAQSSDQKSEDFSRLERMNKRLAMLQASVRQMHSRMSEIAARCDTTTSIELNAVLELCAGALIASMDISALPGLSQGNRNNNSRWADKPENLVEVVSSNLIKGRMKDKDTPVSSAYAMLPRSTGNEGYDAQIFQQPQSPGSRYHADNIPPTDPYTSTAPQEYFPLHTDAEEFFGNRESCGEEPTAVSKYKMSQGLPASYHPPTYPAVSEASVYDRYSTHQPDPAISHFTHSAAVNADHFLHSTLRGDDSPLTERDLSSESVSSLSLGTTIADNAFQEGLAQLDANIAKLQASLKSSKFNSSL